LYDKIVGKQLLNMNINEDLLEGASLLEPRSEFDAALIGFGEQFGRSNVAIYDTEKVVRVLKKQGMTTEEAIEFFEFNILGSCIGEQMPVFLTKFY